MKKHKKIIGALFLVTILVAVLYACTKEKAQTDAKPVLEKTNRKPIATYDKDTKQMTYHISIEQVQDALTNNTKDGDRYVLESWCIVDDEDDCMSPYLKYVVLDTDEEVSHTTILLRSFVEKREYDYYLSEDVVNENYTFHAESASGAIFVVKVEGDDITINEWDGASLAPPGGTSCTCTSNSYCKNNGSSDYVCEPLHDGVGWRCHPPCDPHPKAECNKSVSSSVITPKILSRLGT